MRKFLAIVTTTMAILMAWATAAPAATIHTLNPILPANACVPPSVSFHDQVASFRGQVQVVHKIEDPARVKEMLTRGPKGYPPQADMLAFYKPLGSRDRYILQLFSKGCTLVWVSVTKHQMEFILTGEGM